MTIEKIKRGEIIKKKSNLINYLKIKKKSKELKPNYKKKQNEGLSQKFEGSTPKSRRREEEKKKTIGVKLATLRQHAPPRSYGVVALEADV